jgi:quercetin dioxygenase-like cupin family protein
MKLLKHCLETLQKEGFLHTYEWKNLPGESYSDQQHQGKVTVFVIRGTYVLTVAGKIHELHMGDRFDIPPLVTHSGVAGPKGCYQVIGEIIKGDS